MIPAQFRPIGFDKPRLISLMKERNIDAILLSAPENVFYTTGYPCLPGSGNPILFALKNQLPFFSFIEADGRVTLCAWIGALLGGVEFAADHVEAYLDLKGGLEVLKNFFIGRSLDGKTVGVESTCPWFAVRLIEDTARPKSVTVIDDVIQSLRLIKSAEEIQMIKKSTAIAEATINEIVGFIRPGINRPDLIQEAKRLLVKNGATGIGHVTISFGGSNPELSIDEVLQTGSLVALDLGASFYGYLSDIRRHVYTGAVPDELGRLHETMCGIVADVGKALVPGKTAKELYDLAIFLYEQNKLNPFIINVGHSIGLATEEAWLYNGTDLTLESGMVVNIELYTNYGEGVEVGDEETFHIADGRTVRLTTLSPDIIPV